MLELKTADIAPTLLKHGSILCGDDDVPFAVVSGEPRVMDGVVNVNTVSIPLGKFDVRGFSNDHRFMRTHGQTGITVMPTYPLAVQWCAREMARRTDEQINVWQAYSAVYYADTYRPVRVAELDPFLPLEFPAGLMVKVVDCS